MKNRKKNLAFYFLVIMFSLLFYFAFSYLLNTKLGTQKNNNVSNTQTENKETVATNQTEEPEAAAATTTASKTSTPTVSKDTSDLNAYLIKEQQDFIALNETRLAQERAELAKAKNDLSTLESQYTKDCSSPEMDPNACMNLNKKIYELKNKIKYTESGIKSIESGLALAHTKLDRLLAL